MSKEKEEFSWLKNIIDINNDVVKLNDEELNKDDRKKVANFLRIFLGTKEIYMFKQPILLTGNQKLVVTHLKNKDKIKNVDMIKIKDIEIKKQKFKNDYNDLEIEAIGCDSIEDFDDLNEIKYFLREGQRFLSSEETIYVIDLISKDEDLIFSLHCDIWEEKKENKDEKRTE